MSWEIVWIPGNPPCSSFEQATVHVIAAVVEPKIANTLVRRLTQVSPLENLRHVKRVRRRFIEEQNVLSVILCPADESENLFEGIPADVLKLINTHQLSPFLTRVAKYAASSKEEWEEQCQLWPTSYHPPTSDDDISGFTEKDSQLICNFMKDAIELTQCEKLGLPAKNAAVIVDPSSEQIIASAIDQTFSWSAVVNKSANVEILSSPDSYRKGDDNCHDFRGICTSEMGTESNIAASCLYPWKWTEHKPHSEGSLAKCRNSWHPLRHAAMVAIEIAAARDRNLFPVSVLPMNQYVLNDDLDSKNFSPKRQKTEKLVNGEELTQKLTMNGLHSELTRPYLCTGYDIYLVREPCTMCAMALVHQRIRRIFFALPNPNAGALGSVYRLQGEKSLNHHYSVFRVLLPQNAFDK